ncbi:putative nuclease HARBI1 [Prorops nasuta]|uniref:putative nuclease HARBI1 n=1 Tax=Prorops nasuta TaxID=863751 RepID=UPI0034CF313E
MEHLVDVLFASSSNSDSDDEDIEIFFTNRNDCTIIRPRVRNFIENVIYVYNDEEFKRHFRMSHTWRATKRVVKALCILRNTFIRWPTLQEAESTANTIEEKYKFPKVLGFVDGTHIRIAAPKENSVAYVNRKGFHSIQLQVICNEKREFIHCYAGMPGCVHDMRVFKYSGVQQKCTEVYFADKHLLGDSVYVIQKCVLTPYKNNGHLSEEEVNYNYILSRSRMIIERAIRLLKGRWRFILDKLPMRRTDLIPYYIIACTVLHNICLLNGDEEIEYPIIVANEIADPGLSEVTLEQHQEGIIKRNEMKNYLATLR